LRRQLSGSLPVLAALYGLKWADLEDMPKEELDAHFWQIKDLAALIVGRR